MIQQLQEKLHNEIPLTKLMDIKINAYYEKELLTSAPLAININDKGTAFGGSLSTITIISSWSMCWLISKELGYESKNIVVIKNNTSYLKPVTKDIICHTNKPNLEEILILKEKLENKGSGSIKIVSKIIEDEKVCVEFEGIYIINK